MIRCRVPGTKFVLLADLPNESVMRGRLEAIARDLGVLINKMRLEIKINHFIKDDTEKPS